MIPIDCPPPQLLTDPFLQNPQPESVAVVWFTEFAGEQHWVRYGPQLEQRAIAASQPLSRSQEDARSWLGSQAGDGSLYPQPQPRSIWRHEALVSGLVPGVRVPYAVSSQCQSQTVTSDRFSLAPLPPPGQPLKLLLTSDHQLKPMVAANLQKMAATVGTIDGILMAGDLVNVPDRASEWFDDSRGGAFFPALQGRAQSELGGVTYGGAPLLQSVPLFPALGNHEVMGRTLGPIAQPSLNEQFADAIPRSVALDLAQAAGDRPPPPTDPHYPDWLADRSFNWQTVGEILTWPANPHPDRPHPGYYAVSLGNLRLVVLYATTIWRPWNWASEVRGRYREKTEDLEHPERWGYGQHIFEPIGPGSTQYHWLQQELASPAFQNAAYRVVMFHHPVHTLGDNVVPAYTDPVPVLERDSRGNLTAVRYEYPLGQDYLNRDIAPLLETAGVDLVLYGHSHLWNRFVSAQGLHFLETSNVGNSYGAFWAGTGTTPPTPPRPVPENFQETYGTYGDPWGLEPIVPSISPLRDAQGQPLPYIASNEITVFTILDTGEGAVSSYYFDTSQPYSEAVLFDQFYLGHLD
ncbi:metallophosphoesterase family protein [Prochlorothrix hollandica]|nr:metallophosphoesterase [Prochlorothrix hollandica]